MRTVPTPATLERLARLRSGVALATLAFLDWAAAGGDDFAALPAYFPPRMRSGTHHWFDVLRQRVRVTNQRGGVRSAPGSDAGDESDRARSPRDPEYPYPRALRPDDDRRPLVWPEGIPPEWRRMIVVGDPGGGKSWALRFEERRLALASRQALEDRSVTADRVEWPIRLRLTDLANVADARAPRHRSADRLQDFLVDHIIARARHVLERAAAHEPSGADGRSGRYQGLEAPPPSFEALVRTAMRDGRFELLLDAWDEVRGDRTTLAEHLRALAAVFAGRMVITSRDAGYDREAPPLADAVELQLLTLDPVDVEAFAGRWFTDAAQVPPFLAALGQDRGQLFELARNPLMLTLTCRVFEDGLNHDDGLEQRRPFPQHRVEVYARCLEGLIRDWKVWRNPGARPPGAGYVSDIVRLLSRVASTLLGEDAPYDAHRVAAVVRAGLGQLQGQLPNLAATMPAQGPSPDQAVNLFVEDGLLVPTSGERTAFMWLHRTFAEYLAGVALAEPVIATASETPRDGMGAAQLLADALEPRVTDQREVVLLTCGHVGLVQRELARGAGPAVVAAALETLLDRAQDDGRDEVLALAGNVVAELGVRGVGRECHARVSGRLLDALRGTGTSGPAPDAKRRAAFGNVLARMGDPRFHSRHLWCLPNDVACGFERTHGEDMLGFAEVPQRDSNIPTFFIARWPTTVAQFRVFVQDDRYDAGRDWERGLATHPVVYVNAFDTEEYCAWLSEQLVHHRARLPGTLRDMVAAGWRVSLPSEDQWLRAAQGDTGWDYPWGNAFDPDRANSHETGIGSTSAVGCFPRGASPWGVEELSGNVWEWTSTPRSVGTRVLRGGYFGDYPRGLRAAHRYVGGPGLRYGYGGFRVVLSPFRSDPLISEPSDL